MERNQIWRLALLLVEKHGAKAPLVARERVLLHRTSLDRPVADMWSAVAAAARLMLANHATDEATARKHREPTLDDVLGGAVTRRVMAAHGVDAEHVRDALKAARDRTRDTKN